MNETEAIRKAQTAFTGAAEVLGGSSEHDIQALVDEVRYGKENHPKCMTVAEFLACEGMDE